MTTIEGILNNLYETDKFVLETRKNEKQYIYYFTPKSIKKNIDKNKSKMPDCISNYDYYSRENTIKLGINEINLGNEKTIFNDRAFAIYETQNNSNEIIIKCLFYFDNSTFLVGSQENLLNIFNLFFKTNDIEKNKIKILKI